MRRVVVTGVGVVSPIGIGWAAFGQGLRDAVPGIDTIRSFDASTFSTRIAGEVRGLHASAVAVPEREGPALSRDPKALYGIVAAREALGDAGLDPKGDTLPARRSFAPPRVAPERLAVMVAAGLEIFHLGDMVRFVDGGAVDGERLLEALGRHPPLSRLQIPAHLAAAVLAREIGAAGLFSVNVSACAAGTQSVGEAFRAIREGAADVALTGGYDSMVNPLGVGGFGLLEALSTKNELRGGASRPFDARRDGFVLGEGAAMLVLEAEEVARERGAAVRAEILGCASTLDAFRVTEPAPDRRGAIAAMRGALEDARCAPTDIDYVNAHGTGTPKNDPAETAAIRTVFGDHADRLPVSSTKSQVGHLIGAAGAMELSATIFALESDLLPATINLHEPDPECDLDHVANQPRPARIDRALKNSFGFGGQNVSIVIGRYEP
jgi:3-oxoacyl-[acyl-carrier-protein] synthase II